MRIREVIKAFCAIEKDNRILLVKDIGDDFWKFPGGHLEGVESNERGAIREVLEETGLNIEIKEIFHVEDYFHPKKTGERHIVTFFRARVIGGEARPQPGEIEKLQWFAEADLAALTETEMYPKHRAALEDYLGS